MGVLILSDMPLEIPLLQLEISMKMLGQEAMTLRESKFLWLRPHSDGEISPKKCPPRTPVWTAPALQAVGTGCPICELHF